MIRHLVFFKFKPGTTEADIAKLEQGLSRLPSVISEIATFELGRDIVRSERSFDFGLNAAFADRDALNAYQVHPEHQQVVAHVKTIAEKVVAVDYTF